jgi:hypothetical protein
MAKRQNRRPKETPAENEAIAAAPPSSTWREMLADVGIPFAVSRVLLLIVAWLFADQYRGLTWVAKYSQRGWAYTPIRWIDVWARWDSDWYLNIVKNGYQATGYATGEYTSLAFFPVYPQAVRLLYRLLPTAWQGDPAAVVLGILVANLCALGALAVLYRHVRARFEDRPMARRSIIYLLAFPTAFFLGCFYTESAFLLLAVAAYHMAWRRRWAYAATLGALLSATRPVGVLILLPFVWLQLEDAQFKIGPLLRRAGWLLLVPAGFVAYAIYLWRVTGDVGAVVIAQRAWQRELSSPFALFGAPPNPYGDVVQIDRVLTLAFVAAAVWLLTRKAWRADGLVVCLVLASFMFTGTPLSASRFLLTAFPVFVWLAGRPSEGLRQTYVGTAVAVQTALWVFWVLMRWVA